MAEHKIAREAITAFAELSHDRNALHTDEVAAAASPFGGIVAHGFLLLGGAMTALGQSGSFPRRYECRFHAPGRPGQTIATNVTDDAAFEVRADGNLLVSGRIK